MSRLIIDQDWESTDTPFTLTGAFARSATNVIDGVLDLRGGGGAVAGDAKWNIPAADESKSGSARGLRIWMSLKFKRVTGPTGGQVDVITFIGSEGSAAIRIATGATVLTGVCGGTLVVGATSLTAGTAYQIDIILKEDRQGVMLVYLDGALEMTVRAATSGTLRFGTLLDINLAIVAGAKITWEFIYGRMKIWTGRDAQ